MPLSKFFSWGLYVGGRFDAEDFENLRNKSINYVISAGTKEIRFPSDFQVLRIRVKDRIGENLLNHLDEVVCFISSAKKCGQKVLIHCDVGQSRSCSLAIAYAMCDEKLKLWSTLNEFKSIRRNDGRDVKINSSFLLELYELEKKLFHESSMPQIEIEKATERVMSKNKKQLSLEQ